MLRDSVSVSFADADASSNGEEHQDETSFDENQEPNWPEVRHALEKVYNKKNQDLVPEKMILLLICGLVYLDFDDTCRQGYSERVEKCIVRDLLPPSVVEGDTGSSYASTSVDQV